MNSFKLPPLAKKLLFYAHFLSFYPSIAMLCKSKKSSNEQKIVNLRFKVKSLNEFNSYREVTNPIFNFSIAIV